MILALIVTACATEAPENFYDPLEDYDELNRTGVVAAPGPEGSRYARVEIDVGRLAKDLPLAS